jgi:ABC-type molybdate transport system substrate-binding protein
MVEDKRADWGITFGSSFRFFDGSTPNNRVTEYSEAKTNGAVPIVHLVARLKKSQHAQAAAFQDFLGRDPSYSRVFEGE